VTVTRRAPRHTQVEILTIYSRPAISSYCAVWWGLRGSS